MRAKPAQFRTSDGVSGLRFAVISLLKILCGLALKGVKSNPMSGCVSLFDPAPVAHLPINVTVEKKRIMKIIGITIQNLGSIRNVEFTGLDDRIVMVGPNGSGKTFVIQGLDLLFREFQCQSGNSLIGNVDYLWHKRRTDMPIGIGATLELDTDDVSHIEEAGVTFNQPSGANQLSVTRQLNFNGNWSTLELSLNDQSVIENDKVSESVPSNTSAKLLRQIESLMKAAFVLISPGLTATTRDGRTIEISDLTMNEIKQVSQSTEVVQEARWSRFEDTIEELLHWRYEPQPSEPLIRQTGYRLPSRHIGSGEQRIVDIVWQLQRDVSIVAIEEPEFHLHPGLARRVANSLRTIAPESQIFISTHASQMVDRAEIGNNWMLSLDQGATKAKRVESDTDFQTLLQNLGAFPSDIFLKDFVLFLEGGTEAIAVAPAWAKTLGLDIDGMMNIGLVSIGGASRLKDNLRIWLEQSNLSSAMWHVVLDDIDANELKGLHEDLGIPDDHITILPEHCIEDFYPTDLVLEALESIYKIEETSHQKVSSKPRDRSIRKVLEEHGKLNKGWKVALGMYVASRMEEHQIPSQFKVVVDKMKVFTAQ